MLRRSEFLDLRQRCATSIQRVLSQAVALEAGELGFTYCQVPVVMALADSPSITPHTADGKTESVEERVDCRAIRTLFKKTGHYVRLDVRVTQVMD